MPFTSADVPASTVGRVAPAASSVDAPRLVPKIEMIAPGATGLEKLAPFTPPPSFTSGAARKVG